MTATSEEIIQPREWHNLSASKVAQNLNANLETGLTSDEVVKRRERFDANELKGKRGTSPLLRFLWQFNQKTYPRIRNTYYTMISAILTECDRTRLVDATIRLWGIYQAKLSVRKGKIERIKTYFS